MSPRFEDPLEKLKQAQAAGDPLAKLKQAQAAEQPPAAPRASRNLTPEARELLATRFPELRTGAHSDEGRYEPGEEAEEGLLPPFQEEDRMLAGLSYLAWLLVPPILLLTDKKNEPYVRFHALQGLFLGLACSAGSLVLLLFTWLFSLLFAKVETLAGSIVYVIIVSVVALIHLVMIGLVVFFAYRAHSGRYFRLPLVAGLADRFTPEGFQRF